jgi:hypothetical protein
MIGVCEELKRICVECAKRYVVIVERDDKIIVYADLMRELHRSAAARRVVELHVAKCASELAMSLSRRVKMVGWQEVNGKMRYFCVVV